jgi:serine/threonine-protein kinase
MIRFGKYQLLRNIASGGMGQVLLARKGNAGFEKRVVIKRILPHLVEDETFFAMFVDEAKLAMRLDHPNIVRIAEFGVESGIHYLEMEYVAGDDVKRLERQAQRMGKPLPFGLVLRIVADAAAGLDFAHKATDERGSPLGLVHRDVSPHNIVVGFDGAVKLIDFGVAKATGRSQHTATGVLKGKFPYMSPEQADGRQALTAQSDIFSLGIVLWELSTGRRLFKGDTDLMTQRLVSACAVPPPSTLNPSLPEAFNAIALKALAKSPTDRYADAAAFRMALEEFALAHAIATSHAHLATYMHELYQDRIAQEADAVDTDQSLSAPFPAPLPALRAPAARPLFSPLQPTPLTAPLSTPKYRSGSWVWPTLAAASLVTIAILTVRLVRLHRAPISQAPVSVSSQAPLPGIGAPTASELGESAAPAGFSKNTLSIRVISDPPGSVVKLGVSLKGLTPVQLSIERTQLPLTLVVTHEGYEPFEFELTPSTPEGVVSASLRKDRETLQPLPIKTSR